MGKVAGAVLNASVLASSIEAKVACASSGAVSVRGAGRAASSIVDLA